jgi:hypothetical protein
MEGGCGGKGREWNVVPAGLAAEICAKTGLVLVSVVFFLGGGLGDLEGRRYFWGCVGYNLGNFKMYYAQSRKRISK